MSEKIEFVSGDSKRLVVSVTDDNDTAVDLTGAVISWQLARSVYGSAEISKSVGSGIAITDAVNGEFTVTLDPLDTDALEGDFYHEAQVTDTLGDISTVFSGNITIIKDLI